MVNYNLTDIDAANNYYDLLLAVNSLNGVSQWYASLFLICMYFVLMIIFKSFDTLVAFTAASFIISIVAIFFTFLGLIGITIMSIPIILFGAGLFLIIKES
jgi:hypothetical protein